MAIPLSVLSLFRRQEVRCQTVAAHEISHAEAVLLQDAFCVIGGLPDLAADDVSGVFVEFREMTAELCEREVGCAFEVPGRKGFRRAHVDEPGAALDGGWDVGDCDGRREAC